MSRFLAESNTPIWRKPERSTVCFCMTRGNSAASFLRVLASSREKKHVSRKVAKSNATSESCPTSPHASYSFLCVLASLREKKHVSRKVAKPQRVIQSLSLARPPCILPLHFFASSRFCARKKHGSREVAKSQRVMRRLSLARLPRMLLLHSFASLRLCVRKNMFHAKSLSRKE